MPIILDRAWLVGHLNRYDAHKGLARRLLGDLPEITGLKALLSHKDFPAANSTVISLSILFQIQQVVLASTSPKGSATRMLLDAINTDIENSGVELSPVLKLPTEILARIFGFLKLNELSGVALTCKYFLDVLNATYKMPAYRLETGYQDDIRVRLIAPVVAEQEEEVGIPIYPSALNPSKNLLAVAIRDHIKLINLSGKVIAELHGINNPIYGSLIFSGDRWLVGSNSFGNIDVFDLNTFSLHIFFPHMFIQGRSATRIGSLSNGNIIVENRLYEINKGAKLVQFNTNNVFEEVYDFNFSVSSDDKYIAYFRGCNIYVFDIESNSLHCKIKDLWHISAVKIVGDKLFYSGHSNAVQIYDLNNKTHIKSIVTRSPVNFDFALSKNGRYMVQLDSDKNYARIKNLREPLYEGIQPMMPMVGLATRVYFTANDRAIIVISEQEVVIRNLATKKLRAPVPKETVKAALLPPADLRVVNAKPQ